MIEVMNPYIPYLALGAGLIVLLVWNIILEIRLRRLTGGNNGKSLENVINQNHERIIAIERDNTIVHKAINDLDTRMHRKIDGVRTLRFNPFQGVGGNQSFASAFLDEDGTGVVLSTLYSRERVSIFAKPIIARTSEHDLTEEEKSVLLTDQ